MRIAGAAPAQSYLALVVVEVTSQGWTLVDTRATRKITLTDHEDPKALRDFQAAVTAFIHSYGVERILLRRGTYAGKQRSGAPALKMEAVLQLLGDADLSLVPSQRATARLKKETGGVPAELTAYQHDAFAVALTGVPER